MPTEWYPKKISQPHPKEKMGWEGEERKMENHVCMPLLSLFYEFIEKTFIMRTQIQIHSFLNIFLGISFWVIQIPKRPGQSDRALMGFAHRDAVHSVPDGPAGTSACLAFGCPAEGRRPWMDLAFHTCFREVPNICTSH